MSMPMALERWNDDRLDELSGRVRDMSVAVEKVAPLAERVSSLSDDLRDNKTAVEGLRSDLRGMMGNPLKEARERKTALYVGIIAAVSGGVATAIATLATGGFGH